MDDTKASQWQRAVPQNLGLLARGCMLHRNDNPLGTTGKVHGASHSMHELSGQHPIGQVSSLVNLESSQNAEIEMTATNHGVGVEARKQAGTRRQSDGLFGCIDQVRIPLVFWRQSAETLNTAFRDQNRVDALWEKPGHQRRYAQTEAHVEAVLNLSGCPSGNELAPMF